MNWPNWFLLVILKQFPFVIRLIDCFSVTIPKCYKVVMPTVLLFVQLDFEILYEQNVWLKQLKSRVNRCRSLLQYVLLFAFLIFLIVPPCLVRAIQNCMEWIPIQRRPNENDFLRSRDPVRMAVRFAWDFTTVFHIWYNFLLRYGYIY